MFDCYHTLHIYLCLGIFVYTVYKTYSVCNHCRLHFLWCGNFLNAFTHQICHLINAINGRDVPPFAKPQRVHVVEAFLERPLVPQAPDPRITRPRQVPTVVGGLHGVPGIAHGERSTHYRRLQQGPSVTADALPSSRGWGEHLHPALLGKATASQSEFQVRRKANSVERCGGDYTTGIAKGENSFFPSPLGGELGVLI